MGAGTSKNAKKYIRYIIGDFLRVGELKVLKDKVVVITGASSGIGAETAKLLATNGAVVILLARRLDKLTEIAASFEGTSDIAQLDVGSTEQVLATFDKIITKYRKIDILINNAGFGVFNFLADAPIEELEEMINTNYLGMVRCTKAVLPVMLKERTGHIINVVSLAGKIATAKASGYSASKFAMIGFSDSLRNELGGTGVLVSTVNPGPVDTPFFDLADPSGTYVKNVNWLMLTPKKIAQEIYKVILHRKPEKNLPAIASFGIKLYNLFPRTLDRLLGKLMNKK